LGTCPFDQLGQLSTKTVLNYIMEIR